MKYSATPTEAKSSDRKDKIIKTKQGNKRAMKTCQGACTASNRKQGNVNFIYIKLSRRKSGVSAWRYFTFGALIYTTRRGPYGLIGLFSKNVLQFILYVKTSIV